MVICLERGADLHMAQLMPLPLTVSCFSKIQIGFTFLLPAYPGSPGKRAVELVCVCVCCLTSLASQCSPLDAIMLAVTVCVLVYIGTDKTTSGAQLWACFGCWPAWASTHWRALDQVRPSVLSLDLVRSHGVATTLCLRKKQDTKLLPITSRNVNRFSKFFHW